MLSCSNKGNLVRVDIRVRLEKIGPDYPETGKHPEEYKHNRELEASAARAEKAKRRRQSAIEKQEHEVAEKRRALHDTGKPVSEINFVDEELSHHEDVHREVTDNLCHDFEAECYVQTTMDTESGQDATNNE